MPHRAIYDSLEMQLRIHLLRTGPMQLTRLAMNVRHNGDSAAVHQALARKPDWFITFDYTFFNGRMECARGCVRLRNEEGHSEDDYVPHVSNSSPSAMKAAVKREEQQAQSDFL